MWHGFEDPSEMVAAGYDAAADRYAEAALGENRTKDAHTAVLLDRLIEGAEVLDLGCGAGRPTAEVLSRRFRVTGVDVSSKQLDLARRSVPAARFVLGDMTTLSFAPESFAGAVAFYSIIHVPRDRHRSLFERIHAWLKPGGLLVAPRPRTRRGRKATTTGHPCIGARSTPTRRSAS